MGNARSSGRMQRSVDMPQNVGHPGRKVKPGEILLQHPAGGCWTVPPRLLDKYADNSHLLGMTSVFSLSVILFRVCPIAGN